MRAAVIVVDCPPATAPDPSPLAERLAALFPAEPVEPPASALALEELDGLAAAEGAEPCAEPVRGLDAPEPCDGLLVDGDGAGDDRSDDPEPRDDPVEAAGTAFMRSETAESSASTAESSFS